MSWEHKRDTWNPTLQLTESYKSGMFIAALGARGISPPNLHPDNKANVYLLQKIHIFPTLGWVITINSGDRCDYGNIPSNSPS